jgi:hypothetical protein
MFIDAFTLAGFVALISTVAVLAYVCRSVNCGH